jgi:hypothetical protein
MRKWIGYLVARNGAEDAAACTAAGNFLSDNILADGVGTGSPITIVYFRERPTDGAIEGTAGAIPDLGVFDCGSRAGQAASEGAGRT